MVKVGLHAITLVAIALISSLAGAPRTFAGAEADRAIVEAKVAYHLQSKNYAAAAQVLTHHLERDPVYDRGWNLLGLVRYRAGDAPGANEAFRKAAESAETA